MSLMAAGVPIKAMVAGVAMGLITVGDTYSILTDIQGMEDHYGDMDFKVAGTRKGITALQMDIKVEGISKEILREALAQAHKGRMEILDNMETAIAEPRPDVSKWAPKFAVMHIPTDRIRDVIGTGGKTINQIIEDCDQVKIDVEEDGTIAIYHMNREMINKAKAIIEDLTRDAKVGEEYDATVSEVRESFAFVTLFPGTDALLHVSELSWERSPNIGEVLHIGDKIRVKVTAVDESTGKVKVSARECLEKPEGYVEPKRGTGRNQRSSRSSDRKRSGEAFSSSKVEKRVFRRREE
jgi:polyribonucleotide nucleotidyltransferase